MNYLLRACLVVLTLTVSATAPLAAGSESTPKVPSFAGIWEGKVNELPGINLKIHQAEGTISGNIIFYLQKREDAGRPWHVAGATASPLLAPHVEDGTLTFEVEHHGCDGCSELGPNVKFRMALAGSNEARLWNLSHASDSDHGLILVRQTKPSSSDAVPAMRKGISVELPITSNAVLEPKADIDDALIVTVTRDGNLYVGVNPISAAELPEKLKAALPNGAEKTLYIKADARAPYASVVRVLDSVRTAGVRKLTLLTVQGGAADPGKIVPPKGLEMLVVGATPAARSSATLY